MRRYAVFMLCVISCCVFSHVAANQARFPSNPDTSFNSPGNLNFGRANSAEALLPNAIPQSIAAMKSGSTIAEGLGTAFGGNDIAIFSSVGQRSKVYIVSTTSTFSGEVLNRVAVSAYTQCDGLVDTTFNSAGNFVSPDGSTAQILRPGFFALEFVSAISLTLGEPGLRIVVDSNGRLGVLSNFTNGNNIPRQQPAIVFINPDGTLDTSVNQGDANSLNETVVFAGGGTTDDFESPNGVVLAIVSGTTTNRTGTPADLIFTSNNLPVVVGQSNATLGVGGNTSEKAYFYRLAANGLADATFAPQTNNIIDIRGVASQAGLSAGVGGLWYSGIPGGAGQEGNGLLPRALTRTSTNELFVAGGLAFGASSFGFITKLTNTGDIDTSFGTAGSNAFQADGSQIPVAGGDYQGVGNGTVLISLGDLGPATEITDLKALSDGGVIATGTFRGAVASLPANTNGFVAKFTSQGTLDTSFNSSGLVLTFDGNNPAPGTSAPGILLFSASSDASIITAPTSICLTEGEQVIVTGNRIPGGNTNSLFALALNADGTPNTNANPERTEYTYTGQIGNNPQLIENEGSDFAQYLAIYNMELVDNAVFRGCELNDQNNLFVGGPGRDEYLFALKVFGVGPDPVPVPEDSFVAALVDKYRPFCPTAPCQ